MRTLLAALVLAALPAQADDVGRQEYLAACAVCHGDRGWGDGPMVPALTVRVPDLTQIAAANGGHYPFLDVMMLIDGRSGIRAHGSQMPVWGDRFAAEAADAGPYGTEAVVRRRVLSLVRYLESIQE